jgi:hypothetical protein
MSKDITLWEAKPAAVIAASETDVVRITSKAIQLSERDTRQLVSGFRSGSYEMASTFVWSKTIAALKKQISSLGMEFIGEMLARPDIVDGTSIADAITDYEAISLAEDLGMVSTTDAMRLKHNLETVTHFASLDPSESDDQMGSVEALHCLVSCVQSVLGQPQLQVADGFATFRKQLEKKTFKGDEPEMVNLENSPYFFQRTTLRVLLALLKSAEGAQLEHAADNTAVVLPLIWGRLKKPEMWQTGQTYAEVYAAGRKTATQALGKALLKVHGFDYVPENLRSSTFTQAASRVLLAHEGVNNYYNEPAPMQSLASLGTTIPMPAFPSCMTAALCVWLGNSFGHSWDAQPHARKLLSRLSQDKWEYYLNECLPSDNRILEKLVSTDPQERWILLVKAFELATYRIKVKLVENLIKAGQAGHKSVLRSNAEALLRKLGRA